MLGRIDNWITKTLNIILSVMLFLSAIIIVLNVILRYVFTSGYNGTYELVTLLIINITFIGASLLIVDNTHLTMDAIISILPAFINKVLDIIVCLIGIAFSIIIFIYSIKVITTLGGVTPTLRIPSYIPFLPIAIGFFMTTIKYISRLIIQCKRQEE